MDSITFWIRMLLGMALTAFSLWDYKNKRLPLMPIFCLMLAGILFICGKGTEDLQNIFWGVGLGMFFCIMAKLTAGSIGMGDGLLVLLIGMYIGGVFTFICLCFAFLFSAVAALFLIVVKKKGKKDSLPFIPFLLAGYLMANWLQGGWEI